MLLSSVSERVIEHMDDGTGTSTRAVVAPVVGWASGPPGVVQAGQTTGANLAGYCTGDHRGKHQAPGWTHTLDPDGTLTVTTPTGLTAVTTPPPY